MKREKKKGRAKIFLVMEKKKKKKKKIKKKKFRVKIFQVLVCRHYPNGFFFLIFSSCFYKNMFVSVFIACVKGGY